MIHIRYTTHRQGFTLIELSIVLVIIGLIVGGVLVGQDLIKSAEIRATIAQVEKYNTAVNAFYGKYNGLPGDLDPAQAAELGFFTFTGSNAGTNGLGNNNRRISAPGVGAGNDYARAIGETLIFWRHLSDANLVNGAFALGANVDAASGLPIATSATLPLSTYLPAAKLGRGNYFAVYGLEEKNYYEINAIGGLNADGTYSVGAFGSSGAIGQITPPEAYGIDIKIDDGRPATGIVRARSGAGAGLDNNFLPAAIPPGGTEPEACLKMFDGTLDNPLTEYWLDTNMPLCALRIRFN